MCCFDLIILEAGLYVSKLACIFLGHPVLYENMNHSANTANPKAELYCSNGDIVRDHTTFLYYVRFILNDAGTAFEFFHYDFDCFDVRSNSTES